MHSRQSSERVIQPSAQKGGGVQGGLGAAGVKLNPKNSCAWGGGLSWLITSSDLGDVSSFHSESCASSG